MYTFEINHKACSRRYIQGISGSSNSNVARNAFERTSEFTSFPENSWTLGNVEYQGEW